MPTSSRLYIGLMSGTSLDGIDGVLASFPDKPGQVINTLATSYIAFPDHLRDTLLSLQQSGHNEIHQEAIAANVLADLYSAAVNELLSNAGMSADAVRAIGVHGQTIRHRPELGFSRQTNNPARLAELTGIDVVADFRSRDIAAGGQGAPLVPAFHHAVFGSTTESRAVINIGGFSNISVLPAHQDAPVFGFDTGPGNILMDGWIARHQNAAYDVNGAWAASGTVHQGLLSKLRSDPFFIQTPPKSTGRDSFHLQWLDDILATLPAIPTADVQATLCALTATTIADAIHAHAPATTTAYLCGGGAYNTCLMTMIAAALQSHQQTTAITTTASLGVAPNHVEALAFAWLAERFIARTPANLPAVTGAKGYRVLGALYPA